MMQPTVPPLSAQQTLEALPQETDVLVIGGGIVGSALTYYLTKAGVDVCLLERGEVNREASGTNAGSFHFQIALHQLTGNDAEKDEGRLLAEVRMHIEAADIWAKLEAVLGADLNVHETGGLMVAETDEELALLYAKQGIESRAGLETHVLVGRELRDFAPYLSDRVKGATLCPREGHANPLVSGTYFALRAQQAGAQVRTHAAVTGVEVLTGQARRFRVSTTRGDIYASRVVNAAGAWANQLSSMLGIPLPMRAEGLHVNVTERRPQVLGPMVQHIGRRLTLKQTEAGTFIIGGGWPARPELAPKRYSNYWASAAGNIAVATSVVPLLNDVSLLRTWSGVMAFMNDLSPIVGESRRIPGYHVCLATTGFTLGPMIAQLLAEAMVEGKTHALPAEYSPDRALS